MPNPIAEAFAQAAKLVAADANRRANCLELAGGLEIVYTGDIHGHRQNLAKIIRWADLGFNPDRRLVLQEIIHGGAPDSAGEDRSFEVLLRAVRLKISHPQQVLFLMGNHDLAQFAGGEITKEGRGECKSFGAGLTNAFGDEADEVREAIYGFLRALPLAARCENGVMLTHSLPSPARMNLVDLGVLDRPYQEADFPRGGSVYEWTWGRGHTAEQVAELSDKLGAKLFLLGHQPVETGFETPCEGIALLASNHAHGKIMVFNSSADIAHEDLPSLVKPIAAL